MWRVGLFICLFTCALPIRAEQELSSFVYPSEDELEEAFRNGEINFIQLITLQEIVRFGIDSAHLYLLDEIPNLSSFLVTTGVNESEFVQEQQRAFRTLPEQVGRLLGKISHSYSQRLEGDNESRYHTSGQFSFGSSISSTFRMHREFSGVERVIYRNVRIAPRQGALKSIIVGNYSTRLGLGTVVGYRGKLLDFSGQINGESFLYPDYGGYNGLHVALETENSSSELMFSAMRDADHSISTVAGSHVFSSVRFKPQLILAATHLRNRTTSATLDEFKYGLGWELTYRNGYSRTEISAQSGESSSFGAVMTEGRHIFGGAEIAYAGWVYDDDFLDLTTGSKAGTIRQSVDLDEVEYSYSDKHQSQEGGLLKTIVGLTENTSFTNSLVFASKDDDNYNLEFLTAIEKRFNSRFVLRIDHTRRSRYRLGDDNTFRRSRVELRYVNPQLFVRAYVAFSSKTDEDDYFSVMGNVRYSSTKFGQLIVWSNLGRFNHNEGKVEYWYNYVENRHDLVDNVRTIMKLSHSFRRSLSDEHSSTISLGLEVKI